MFKDVYWDMSGLCNAACPYCCNGKNSISGTLHRERSKFLDPEVFPLALKKLEDAGLILPGQTLLSLYNWGEPLLHPNLNTIMDTAALAGYSLSLSTNASRRHEFSPTSIPKLTNLTFSMSGFSQASYDRIHGFKFEKILSNILTMMDQLLRNGFQGKFEVSFHVYQFNVFEIQQAKEFFSRLPVGFAAYLAYFNGSTMRFAYFQDTLPKEMRDKATSELFTYQYKDMVRPKDYQCPQYDYLTLDEECNVLLCCAVDKQTEGYSIGNLFNMDLTGIDTLRRSSPTCALCQKLNCDYNAHNPVHVG